MLYLIVSLIAGLFFLISGKVKSGKTVYLEGAKARMAGLIFLAPLGLVLIIFVINIMLDAIGTPAVNKAWGSTVDTFSSALVRNGFMIGLAYIYFHSVSRETKDRKGCLTYWLAYAAILALLLIWFVPNFISNTEWYKTAAIGCSIFQIIFIVGVWLWKKWGVFGYAAITLISSIIAYFRVGSILEIIVSLITSLSLVLAIYLLVKPKWQFFE
ncbi:hypothetical protein ANAEL_00970 [Anaerolineales bacterium]|nr:hypothetical protein ANAEL_00970 [Anaerolineales bacterium]